MINYAVCEINGKQVKVTPNSDILVDFLGDVKALSCDKVLLIKASKAKKWNGKYTPLGGHIEKGEMPIDTVRREFVEELDFNLTKQTIDLFDLSIKDVSGNPLHKCKLHFDFWYLVDVPKINFNFLKKEFYDALKKELF